MPAPERFIDLDPYRLRYRRQGAGPPLVLIHGAYASLDDFTLALPGQRSFFDHLASAYDVVGLDRPGSGCSRRPRRTAMTPTDHASVIHRLLGALGITSPAVLVGHSYGAAVALALALEHPQQAAGLVLVAPLAYQPDSVPRVPLRSATRPVIGDVLLWTVVPLYARTLGLRLARVAFEPEPTPWAHVRRMVAQASRPGNFRAQQQDMLCLTSALPQLARRYPAVAVPALIATGQADVVCPPALQAEPLHRDLPRSELLLFPGLGHALPQLHPAELSAVVCRWTQRTAVFSGGLHTKPAGERQ